MQVAFALEKSLDSLSTLTVMFGVVCGLSLAALFLSFEIYGESIHLVNLISNVVNSTIVNNPELSSFLPDGLRYGNSSESVFFDQMIGNAYLYGRKWLKRTVRNVLNVGSDESSLNASMAIEKQLLEVLDRSYQMWLIRDTNSTEDSEMRTFVIQPKYINSDSYNWNKLIEALKTLDFGLCFHLFKDNIDTVLSVRLIQK